MGTPPRSDSDRHKAYRQLCKELGACVRCLQPVDGTECCGLCRASEQERRKGQRTDRIAKGLCARCGRVNDRDKKECSECALLSRARSKLRYHKLKAKQICPRCQEPTEAGKAYCSKCSTKGTNDGKAETA